MPLYDTSIPIGHLRGNPRTNPAIRKLEDRSWPVLISSITLFELEWGCRISRDPSRMRALTEQYLPFFSAVLPVDEAVAYRAAEVQASLRPTSQMLDLRDLLIAATALVHGLSICSLNTEHFRRVPGLHLEPLP